MSTRTLAKLLPLGLAIPLLMGVLVLAQKGNPKKVKKLIHLTASQVDPGANGIAKIMLKTKGNAIQRFQLVGANLKAGTAYALVVDGTSIATKTADSEQGDADPSGGAVEFIYFKDAEGDSEDGSEPLPAALDLVTNIKHVELQDDKKQVVLSGDFPQ
jgi:hypothetical protein